MPRLQGSVIIVLPRHAETYTCTLPSLVLAGPLAQVRWARQPAPRCPASCLHPLAAARGTHAGGI